MIRFLVPVALTACMADPDAVLSPVRVHTLGPGHFMVTCVDGAHYCAEQARKQCPSGMDVESNTTNAADYGRMTMIIRCT